VTYEQWDAIADAVNPVMAIMTLMLPLLTRSTYAGRRIAFYTATAISMVAMYALGWLDARLHVWAFGGMDYSTHSGFTAVLVASVWLWKRAAGVAAAAIGAAYAVLMLYQGYHSIADIVSTVAVITALTLGIHLLRAAVVRRRAASTSAPVA
jgi:hypothetical protein